MVSNPLCDAAVAKHEPSGTQVAIKILNREKIKTMDMTEKVAREITSLKQFRHPHVTRL